MNPVFQLFIGIIIKLNSAVFFLQWKVGFYYLKQVILTFLATH